MNYLNKLLKIIIIFLNFDKRKSQKRMINLNFININKIKLVFLVLISVFIDVIITKK